MISKQFPSITKDEFDERVAAGEQLIGFDGAICNISGIVHPGGDFLHHLVGTDATENILIAHAGDAHVKKLLKLRAVALMEKPDSFVPKEDLDFRALREELEGKGLFEKDEDLFTPLVEPLIGLAIAVYLMVAWDLIVIGVLLQTVAYLRLFWCLHDTAHHANFSDGKATNTFLEAFGILFFASIGSTNNLREHSVHHSFVNVKGIDWTSLSMFHLDPESCRGIPKWRLRLQFPLFAMLLGCFWFYAISLSVHRVLFSSQPEKLMKGTVFACRMYSFWIFGWKSYVPIILALHFATFVSCLNHLCMEMFESPKDPMRSTSYLRVQTEATLSMNSGWLWTYLAGGLDYHAEHHLFPTAKHSALPEIRQEVMELMARHDIPYHVVPVGTAVWLVYRQFTYPENGCAAAQLLVDKKQS